MNPWYLDSPGVNTTSCKMSIRVRACKKKGHESIVDLGREVAKLAKLNYPAVDSVTREVIGINSFLEAPPGPA